MGIERSTFIIQDGVIRKLWRGVKAPEHIAWVKRSLEEMKAVFFEGNVACRIFHAEGFHWIPSGP